MPQPPASPKTNRNVVALGLTSFFNDTATESAYWILPLFLTSTLHAGPAALGWIEGVAEGTASFAKLLSGWWTDRVGLRKPFVSAGYFVANAAKPLLALTTTPLQVLGIRVADRFSKGIRGAPRDAMLAESVDKSRRGAAFGFRQAMDSAGAVVGPLAAFLQLRAHFDYRTIFWLAAVPGAMSVFTVLAIVRETGTRKQRAGSRRGQSAGSAFTKRFIWLLAANGIFAIGNSSDLFLVLRAQQFGIVAAAPLLGLVFNVSYTALAWPAGHVSDFVPRKWLLAAGYFVFACVYEGFAIADATWQIWLLFASYGLYYALAEGVLKAMIADAVPAESRGRAYGMQAAMYGALVLAASLITGQLWQRFGAFLPFTVSACLAALAALLVLFL